MNNLEIPIYIVSKGRYDSMLTSKSLNWMNIKHYIVIEKQEYDLYKIALKKFNIITAELLILDKKYQDTYETFDNLGSTKSKGPRSSKKLCLGTFYTTRKRVALGNGWQYKIFLQIKSK